MKYFKFLLFGFLSITLSSCLFGLKDPCHKKIKIKNNSDTAIIFAQKFGYHGPDSCILTGAMLLPDSSFSEVLYRHCYENLLRNGNTFQLYILPAWDTIAISYPPKYTYDCDSINKRYNILKKYDLTLKELQDMDFTITYP